jgi:all-trans-retinol 13,14-reductase
VAARVLAQLQQLPPSPGHLCLYVGLTLPSTAPRLDPGNLWVHPGPDFDGNVLRSAANPDAPLPFLYISFPSAKNPAFAAMYPGHHTIEVVTTAPYEWFRHWEGARWKKRGADYEAFKQRLAARLLDALYRHVPVARGAVTTWELSTPLSTRHFTNQPIGEIYGLPHSPARFSLRCLGPRTPVRNLFVTGQDVTLCGVVGALSAAMVTASALLGRNLSSELPKMARTT